MELAVTANCDFIVTYNQRDFRGAERFGLRVVTPKEFLEEIGERGSRNKFEQAMAKVADVEPLPHDVL